MATTENSGLITYKDKSGNTYLMYPVTKAELVDGLDEAIVEKVGTTAPQSHAATHAKNGSDPISVSDLGFTKGDIGLDKVDNTADADKSVKYATTAGTADKTANSFIVRLNGGTTEGTDKFTFNGSAAKSVDITAAQIGAMSKAIYDADSDGKVDDAKNGLWLYNATLVVDGWSVADSGYAQTVAITAADGGPTVTANTQLSGPMCLPTGVQETDETLQETLSIINAGVTTSGDGSVTIKVWEQPSSDITVYWYGR